MREIAEHNHYVQGVAWDPLNEFLATQSSDRSMHIYSISDKDDVLDVHAIGKNTRMRHRHRRTPSSRSRPPMFRRESTVSETESVITSASEQLREEASTSSQQHGGALLTPTASVPSTPASMFPPPPMDYTPSRRSSFSSTSAAHSPATHSRYGRSPSPMPALPAIRPQASASWASVKLYGDESYTNFFRRLSFSPDGGLLLTPAGQFEDPSVQPGSSRSEQPSRGRKGNPSPGSSETTESSSSSVYIYSRANFARPPIARLPGFKKASVAVRFSPVLYELRPGVYSGEQGTPPNVVVEKGKEEQVDVDLAPPPIPTPSSSTFLATPAAPPSPTKSSSGSSSSIAQPAPRIAIPTGPPPSMMMPSPALSATDSLRPPTPMTSRGGTPAIPPTPTPTGSIFSLPYRMLYAVATMDTVAIYDTQQAGPVCLLTKLHYDEFTDMTWYVRTLSHFYRCESDAWPVQVIRRSMPNALLTRRLLHHRSFRRDPADVPHPAADAAAAVHRAPPLAAADEFDRRDAPLHAVPRASDTAVNIARNWQQAQGGGRAAAHARAERGRECIRCPRAERDTSRRSTGTAQEKAARRPHAHWRRRLVSSTLCSPLSAFSCLHDMSTTIYLYRLPPSVSRPILSAPVPLVSRSLSRPIQYRDSTLHS